MAARKSLRPQIKVDLLRIGGHVQHHQDGLILVAAEIGEHIGIVWIEGNIVPVQQGSVLVTQGQQVFVKLQDGIRILTLTGDIVGRGAWRNRQPGGRAE